MNPASMRQLDPSPSFLSHSSTFPGRLPSSDFIASNVKCVRLKHEAPPYPSPVDSQLDISQPGSAKRASFTSQQYGDMPPPSQLSPRHLPSGQYYFDNGHKRTKLSPPGGVAVPYQGTAEGSMGHRTMVPGSGMLQASARIPAQAYSPPNSGRIPPSPAASSNESDESQQSKLMPSSISQPDRRMSIESLITGSYTASTVDGGLTGNISLPSQSSTPKNYHGVDPGYRDFDMPFNNDQQALDDTMPSINARPKILRGPQGTALNWDGEVKRSFWKEGFIKVQIPDEFEPLPAMLRDSPINLLYFNHFISYTSRILVPHDCPGNPFRKILPRSKFLVVRPRAFCLRFQTVALRDTNLLKLLLAYSASHRARLMHYDEPTTRISHYIDGIFESLGRALHNPNMQISNSTFATAIMLASLEIISPNAFDAVVPIAWNTHLGIACSVIHSRGIHAQTVDRNDDESYFLTRWFAYLDVLGCLSGGREDLPLFNGNFWANDPKYPDQAYRIDCFFGFTDRCIGILASIAVLAKDADVERTAYKAFESQSQPFKLSQSILDKVDRIRNDLRISMAQPYHACNHTNRPRRASSPAPPSPHLSPCLSPHSATYPSRLLSSTAAAQSDATHALELTTTNDAYHWAGQIYLFRRVLGRPSSDPQLQDYVHNIVAGLGKIATNGTAEACMLFPIFIAGCEASGVEGRDQATAREVLKQRMANIEGTGMTQARKAREVMEAVWKLRDERVENGGDDEDVGWEGLVGKDFIVC